MNYEENDATLTESNTTEIIDENEEVRKMSHTQVKVAQVRKTLKLAKGIIKCQPVKLVLK